MSIDVFELDEKDFYPNNLFLIYKSKNENRERIVQLLLYKKQFYQIKKLNTFIGAEDKRYPCRNCLATFTTEAVLKEHQEMC